MELLRDLALNLVKQANRLLGFIDAQQAQIEQGLTIKVIEESEADKVK